MRNLDRVNPIGAHNIEQRLAFAVAVAIGVQDEVPDVTALLWSDDLLAVECNRLGPNSGSADQSQKQLECPGRAANLRLDKRSRIAHPSHNMHRGLGRELLPPRANGERALACR